MSRLIDCCQQEIGAHRMKMQSFDSLRKCDKCLGQIDNETESLPSLSFHQNGIREDRPGRACKCHIQIDYLLEFLFFSPLFLGRYCFMQITVLHTQLNSSISIAVTIIGITAIAIAFSSLARSLRLVVKQNTN